MHKYRQKNLWEFYHSSIYINCREEVIEMNLNFFYVNLQSWRDKEKPNSISSTMHPCGQFGSCLKLAKKGLKLWKNESKTLRTLNNDLYSYELKLDVQTLAA